MKQDKVEVTFTGGTEPKINYKKRYNELIGLIAFLSFALATSFVLNILLIAKFY